MEILKWVLLVILISKKSFGRPFEHFHHSDSSSHSSEDEDISLTGAMMYLMKYGYMSDMSSARSASLLSPDFLKQHIIEFQAFAGLNQTGELDPKTVELMKMPRCGVKDKVGKGNKRRRKRYALQGSRWRVKNLTYRISRYPHNSSISKEGIDAEFAGALKIWSDHTQLTFAPKAVGNVHIDIRFDQGEHGDGDPFDGRGGTLAHAFFPVFGGDAHFDDDENWTSKSRKGTNLIQAAAHEFGHSLGLSHSSSHRALMAPFYRGYDKNLRLHKDDIDAIQILYGKPKPKTSLTPALPTPESFPTSNEICDDSEIDAIFMSKDKRTYAFKGSKYWKLTDDSVEEGYPRDISRDWDGLPSDIDSAFTWITGKTYFFKGSRYWRFTEDRMDAGYPKFISEGFQGIPNNIDASFVWGGNGKIFFFKGDKYWRFDPKTKPPVRDSYPRKISNWEGIPNNIDDVLQYSNGYTYFFKDGQYWRFNDRGFKVDKAKPSFPRSTGQWWFGCPASTSSDDENKGKKTTTTTPKSDNNSGGDGGSVDKNDVSISNNNNDNSTKTTVSIFKKIWIRIWPFTF